MKRITPELLKACCPQAKVDLVTTAQMINLYFPRYGIKTNREIRYYLAQCFEETDGLKTFKEYASGAAYEWRKDLGNTVVGDGKRYPGRGMIMTTGRANYKRFGDWLLFQKLWPFELHLLDKPEMLRQPKYAVLGAVFYYLDHKRNSKTIAQIIDTGDFVELTRAINGGTNGYLTRVEYLGRLNAHLDHEDIDWGRPIGVTLPDVVPTLNAHVDVVQAPPIVPQTAPTVAPPVTPVAPVAIEGLVPRFLRWMRVIK